MSGVHAGAADEHLRPAMVSPVSVCDRCHGGGRLWGGKPWRHYDDGTNETTCDGCGGRGTVPTPASRLGLGEDGEGVAVWVSWKRQQTGAWPPRYAWRATVSETMRVEGKPRVAVVGNLGSVAEGKEGRAANRFAFWTRAERRLERFVIPSADRDRFRATLAERVEPFDDAGVFADPAEWLALYDIDPALGVAIFRHLASTLAPDDVADRRAVLRLAKVRLALREAEAAQIRARRRIVGRSTAAASEN